MSTVSYLRHLLERIRREPKSQLVLDAFARLGVAVRPFYLFEERLPAGEPPGIDSRLRDAEIRLLGPEDMKAVAAVPWRGLDESLFLRRLDRGSGCLALFDSGRLAAFTWYDRSECDWEGWRVPLRGDEAYLFDAFTLAPWRGKGAAPYLRYRVYRMLEEQGCRRFFSVSIRTNRAAIRFKEKLGGRVVAQGYRVTLFGRWHFGSRPPKQLP